MCVCLKSWNMFLGFSKFSLVIQSAITGCFKRPGGIISDRPSPHRLHGLTELQVRKGRFISGQACMCSPVTSDDLTGWDALVFVIGRRSRWRGRFPLHHCSEDQEEAVGWNIIPKTNLFWFDLLRLQYNIRAKPQARRFWWLWFFCREINNLFYYYCFRPL